MADFQLELELVARIEDLEKGMKEAQAAVETSSARMEEATKSAAEKGLQPFIEKLAKIGATLFLAEGALKVGAAAVNAFTGDAEGMANALKSIPIFGPLITAMFDFEDALNRASGRMRDLRSETLKTSLELEKLSRLTSDISTNIGLRTQRLKLEGKTELEIARETLDSKKKLIDREFEVRAQQERDALKATKERIKEEHLGAERTKQLVDEATKAFSMQALILATQKQAQKDLLDLELKSLEAKKKKSDEDEAAAAIEAERIRGEINLERIAKIKAEHAREMEKREAERLKIAKEEAKVREAAFEKQLKLTNSMLTAEKEIAKARADAASNVSRATATFSTAGGSFTAGISAQLNEAKLLTKISNASKELLAEIVRNTAGIGAGLV